MPEVIIHCDRLRPFVRDHYSVKSLNALMQQLNNWGNLDFPQLDNGLFPAAIVSDETAYTGYGCVWVRDTVHIAYAQFQIGEVKVAIKSLPALMDHFCRQRSRFEAIISGDVSSADLYQRPAIKFNDDLSELDEPWPHAQNDALGYFLWFYCQLLQEGRFELSEDTLQTLALFPPYFQSIQYWQAADHGHWEEAPKVEASSIGAVIAGLRSLHTWLASVEKSTAIALFDLAQIQTLIDQGQAALEQILPVESLQPYRAVDSALLFLIYPLQVVKGAIADQIVQNVVSQLQGDYGIRRYRGDSYWCADYLEKVAAETRSGDFSESMAERDRLLHPGEEAQWCLFDPIISAIYGQRFQLSQKAKDLRQQTHYLNRALGQITGKSGPAPPYRCPELYYLSRGTYMPNDSVPLLWTQANLAIALHCLHSSLVSAASALN